MSAVHLYRDPDTVAGCKMPSYASIASAEVARRDAAERASQRLLTALLRYGARHGLPNLSPAWCASQIAPVPQPAPRAEPKRPRKTKGDAWSRQEDDLILQLRAKNFGYGSISFRLPGRSTNAVAARIRLLRQRMGQKH